MRPGDTFRGMAHFFSSTGALADADDLPVGVLRRNGVTLAGAAVTVTKVGTGAYTWSVLLDPDDGWVTGDTADVEISGAVGTIEVAQSISTVIGGVRQTGDAYARIGEGGAGLTAVAQASAYTAERAEKLDYLDAAVSSRLAAADYAAPDNAGIAAAKAAAEATNARLPANPAQEETVSSRLAAADYVTPPTVAQVREELDAHSTSLATLMTRLSAERAALLDTLARLDVAVSSRLAASVYTAPDNASIAQAAADAATVASRLTATRAAHLDAPISGIPAAVWSHAQRTLTDLGLTGLGANPVVVHVQDDAGAPLLGQMVTVLDAAGTHVIAVAITDAKGAATLNLPTGEVLLAALSSISHVAPEPVSYEVVPGAQDGPTITLSARFVAVAPEPGLCLVYGRLITGDGKPVVGATARAELRDTVPVAEGNLLSRASVMSEPSDADGVFRMLLLASKAYRVLFDADRQWRDVVVPAAPALDLGTLPAR